MMTTDKNNVCRYTFRTPEWGRCVVLARTVVCDTTQEGVWSYHTAGPFEITVTANIIHVGRAWLETAEDVDLFIEAMKQAKEFYTEQVQQQQTESDV
jgi:hypothetical protein